MSAKKALVLLSGGLDSATVLALAKKNGHTCHALSFRYGQRHEVELECAEIQSRGISRSVIDIPQIVGSSLTDGAEIPSVSSIPTTYVPARNTLFLSVALGIAEVMNADIWIGVNAVDYSGYPDCRPEYINAFQKMADLATRAGVEGRGLRIVAPLLHMSKVEIIRLGFTLGVDYTYTSSCYRAKKTDVWGKLSSCGECDSCKIRNSAFAQVVP